MASVNAWGSDVQPSMPTPLTRPALVDLGGSGFCFTVAGIAHYVTEADLEYYSQPTYSPPLPNG